MITITDLMPLALALATQELLDSRRFRRNFCDNLILGQRERLQPKLLNLKRELNLSESSRKFFEGYKITIISNLDKIIGLVSRQLKANPATIQKIVESCKSIMEDVLNADNFEKISQLEPKFKSQVTLELFKLMKETRI
jgi:hypothetical protein